MKLLPLYESHFKQSLTKAQYQTLKILIWLLTVQKTVRIERLAACFPLPITYESRRKHIQRFLTLSSLSLPLWGTIWNGLKPMFTVLPTYQLTNLILLIAIAYTISALRGKLIKNSGFQKYISRLKEIKRQSRRHSNFWVGLYGDLWIIAWEFLVDVIQDMMNINRHKLPLYQKGLRAMSWLQNT